MPDRKSAQVPAETKIKTANNRSNFKVIAFVISILRLRL